MVTLLYHKRLDAAWTSAAQRLRAALAQECPSFRLPPASSPGEAEPAEEAASSAAGAGEPAAAAHGGSISGRADTTGASAAAKQSEQPSANSASHASAAAGGTAQPRQAQAAANGKAEALLDDAPLPGVLGRSRKQRIVLGRDFVTERLDVGGRTLTYRQAVHLQQTSSSHACTLSPARTLPAHHTNNFACLCCLQLAHSGTLPAGSWRAHSLSLTGPCASTCCSGQ